jgi:hypothetical protein
VKHPDHKAITCNAINKDNKEDESKIVQGPLTPHIILRGMDGYNKEHTVVAHIKSASFHPDRSCTVGSACLRMRSICFLSVDLSPPQRASASARKAVVSTGKKRAARTAERKSAA